MKLALEMVHGKDCERRQKGTAALLEQRSNNPDGVQQAPHLQLRTVRVALAWGRELATTKAGRKTKTCFVLTNHFKVTVVVQPPAPRNSFLHLAVATRPGLGANIRTRTSLAPNEGAILSQPTPLPCRHPPREIKAGAGGGNGKMEKGGKGESCLHQPGRHLT
ncbi:hypothetical protein DV515_00004901, partial [Chloebia gouldiae]